ncbi:MAG: hypothetical protein WC516_09555 [Patescibacteria group bacterium]
MDSMLDIFQEPIKEIIFYFLKCSCAVIGFWIIAIILLSIGG